MSWSDVFILLGTLAVSAIALWLLQHFVPHRLRETHNDVAGFIFAAVGVMYAVLLAFVVIAVWQNLDSARQTTFKEADALAGVYWISRELPLPLGSQLEHNTLEYARTVQDTEWPLMSQHRSSPQATQLVYAMRSEVLGFTPADARQQVLFEHAVTHVEELASERRERLTEVDDSVPTIMWVALIAGALLTVGFTYLFGLSNTLAHGLMVLTLTALVVVSLLLIKEMDFPFTGVTRVEPTAFEVFLSRLPPPR
ncbi:DUF4239 domain-containing protein [Streptacidiphilus jiangxiensis]|uniref:DUF4239 domain-containing protein n=1 Tax=Streptacidiphilus jiangxiensis TaxID=235985 RepID=A0A1H7F0H5_STRJI|nr:DUF4239 domain-containing protein [Streptacidiphilus jiangxiensis]SEK19601.1 Protein of unknown function [Streptacidiphilus jiangxiensis]